MIKSKSLQKNVNHIDNLGLNLTRGKREKEHNFEERIMNHVRGKLIRGKRESATNFEERLKQYSKKFQKKYWKNIEKLKKSEKSWKKFESFQKIYPPRFLLEKRQL